MKSIVEMFNESLVNESSKHLISCSSASEASDKACEEASKKRRHHDEGMMIEYYGSDPDKVADKFYEWYGVNCYYSKESNTTYIPCTNDIEKEICYSEEKTQEIFSQMGLDPEAFGW